MPTPAFVGSVNSTDVSLGAGADESGIILGDLSYDLENPQVDFLDRFGGVTGYATNYAAAINYSVNGVVSSKAAGLNIATFTAAISLNNADFFASASSTHNGIDFAGAEIRLVGVSGSQPQGGARTIDLSLNRPLGFDATP